MTTRKPHKGTPGRPPAAQEPAQAAGETLRGRLVLASGRTVAVANTNSTEHYDDEIGQTVAVVSSYYVSD